MTTVTRVDIPAPLRASQFATARGVQIVNDERLLVVLRLYSQPRNMKLQCTTQYHSQGCTDADTGAAHMNPGGIHIIAKIPSKAANFFM